MNTMDFTKGTVVYGQDNEPVGEILEVWADTATHGCLPVSRYLTEDYGPIKGTRELLTTSDGFVQVRQGHFLGMGGRDHWIPLSAIQSEGADSRITLTVIDRSSEARFGIDSSRMQQAA